MTRPRPPWGDVERMGSANTSSIGLWAAETPNKVACYFPDRGETLSFAGLHARATRAAHWLLGLGLEPGASVALLLENGPAIFELALAAELAGLYYVPISTHLRPAEIGYILDDCRACLLVTAAEYRSSLPDHAIPQAIIDGKAAPGEIDYDGALAGQSVGPVPARPVGRDVLYSSGTTGQPKGVFRAMLPAERRDDPPPVFGVLQALGADASTVYLSTGPLYHAAPHRFTLRVLRQGGSCVVPRRFDAAGALALIEQHRVTHSQWVPTMFVRLLALPPAMRDTYDLGSMRCAVHAAAPCPIPVKEKMIAWWGPILSEYYSGSESIGSTWIESLEWLEHKGSVGRALSGTIHIADEAGRELPRGEVGTIWFSGLPRFEYLNAPEKTRAAVNDKGWATYGDIGHVDAEGYLYLSDRRADLILSGGVNVYPQEVENVLVCHPGVADAAVIGVPDHDLGERVQAVVVLRSGMEADEGALIAFCRERLSSVKCPKSVHFVESLPRSDIGKLLRRVLKNQYRAPGDNLP